MSERTSYAPGTPCWIDLGTPDQDAAAEFYGGLFGWSVAADENAEQTGGYRVATLRGKAIGGVMKLMEENQPPAWSTYVCVEDVDAAAAKVREAGGTLAVEPMDVLDYGRLAFFTDPEGAFLGLWQPGRNKGSELVNEPGAVSWNELNTRDPEAAKKFYGAVFGWQFDDQEVEGTGTYTSIGVGDGVVAGMLDMSGRAPEAVPAHWQVYFAVEDCDATVAKAKEMGGNLGFGPLDIPPGRFAIVSDPHGAHFAVIALNEKAREQAP